MMFLQLQFSQILLLVSTVILLICNSSVEGIYCFQCNSLNDPECASLKANDTHSYLYRQCEQQAYTTKEVFCRKIVQVIADRGNLVRVVRRCSWERHTRLPCYYVSNRDHTEVVCQCFTDGCNSGSNLNGSLIISVLVAVLVTILK